jgi:phosphoglycolate phosphatase
MLLLADRTHAPATVMPAPTIVFDLDGTLVDTAPDLVATLNLVLGNEGIAPVEFASARNMVGRGARAMIRQGLAAQHRMLPASEIERMFHAFIAHYGTHIADHSRPFAGVEAALEELAARGCRLAVCTNKLEHLSIQLLDALGLSRYFAAVCGQDTFAVQKPDPEILRRTIARAGGRPEAAAMVGDSATDIATARAASIPVVAVDFGYSETPVAALRPDRLVSRFADLPAAIFELVSPPPGPRAG